MSRTLVIGDIHGGLKALIQVLDKTKITTEDKLIFLGDYVDGWSETSQLLDFLINLNETHNCIFMIGNHDLWHLDWLKDGIVNESWVVNGGKATIDSYAKSNLEQKNNHLDFLLSMKGFHIDEYNRLYVHAGFTSVYGAQKEKYHSNFSWDRTLWETALCIDKNIGIDSPYFPARFKLYKEIFIGHSATTKYGIHEPMNIFNIWNIDTGAGFSGKLTIIDVKTKEYWQSEFTKDLYPNEGGRIH
jgi:serine/threonine protein phosphatase 1